MKLETFFEKFDQLRRRARCGGEDAGVGAATGGAGKTRVAAGPEDEPAANLLAELRTPKSVAQSEAPEIRRVQSTPIEPIDELTASDCDGLDTLATLSMFATELATAKVRQSTDSRLSRRGSIDSGKAHQSSDRT